MAGFNLELRESLPKQPDSSMPLLYLSASTASTDHLTSLPLPELLQRWDGGVEGFVRDGEREGINS